MGLCVEGLGVMGFGFRGLGCITVCLGFRREVRGRFWNSLMRGSSTDLEVRVILTIM